MICKYCELEITDAAVDSHDGCCPECGMLLLKPSLLDKDDDDYEDEPEDDIDDLDEDFNDEEEIDLDELNFDDLDMDEPPEEFDEEDDEH